MSKIPFDLVLLQEEYQTFLGRPLSNQLGSQFQIANQILQLRPNGQIIIDAIAAEDVNSLLNDLKALGLQNFAIAGRIISGSLPITSLTQAANLPSLQFLNPAYRPITNLGLTTSQGDQAIRANLMRNVLGLTGVGTTVGILSDSFARAAAPLTTFGQDISSGDLPGPSNPNGFIAPVNILDDTAGGSLIDEGRAMAQLIHDLAPAAQLSFHTAFNGIANFAQGIRDLANAGATVIVDDVFNLREPFFQDGPIAQAVDEVVGNGIPYFSSAGNSARQSYQSAFINSGVTFNSGQIPLSVQAGNSNPGTFFGGTAHDFDPGAGVDVFQRITIKNNARFFISFQWNDPFQSVSGTGTTRELDVYLLNAATNAVVAGAAVNSLNNDPVEILNFTNTGADADFNLLILQRSGNNFPSLLKYINFGNSSTTVEYDTQSYTIVGHANAAGAAAVGAAFYRKTPAFGTNPPELESFSSRGTTAPSIFFSPGGAPIAEIRQKPEFVAPDGGNTTFFLNNDVEADSFPNFFGTSAAAPHAAAVAALIQQGIPGVTPTEIYTAMKTTAIDMNGAGYDINSGFGLIDGLEAINALPHPTVNGNSSRNNLTGGNGLDLINGGAGADTLTGGLAQDIFIYNSVRDAGDLIVGFEPGIDRFDFRGLATSLGQTGQNLITNSFINFQVSGSDTRILLDNDGVGTAFIPRPYILVQNITVSSLNQPINFIF